MSFRPRKRTAIAAVPCVLEVNDPAHTTQYARSIEYAKALAPDLFQRLGSQAWGVTITLMTLEGQIVGVYSQNGWEKEEKWQSKER